MSTPSPRPTNEHLQELIAGYVLNALSTEEAAEFETYLQQYPELAHQLRDHQEVMGLLAHTVQQSAPAGLRDRILAIPNPVQPSRVLPFRRVSWKVVGGSIAVIALLGLGIQNIALQQKLHSLEAEVKELQEHETYSFALKGTPSAKNASASIFLIPHSGKVLVAVQNLPPLPAGEAYHLWAFTKDEKIACGQFNTSQSGQWVSQFSVSSELYKSPVKFMRISREPVASSPDASRRVLVMTSES